MKPKRIRNKAKPVIDTSNFTKVAEYRRRWPQFFSAGWQRLCKDSEYRVADNILYIVVAGDTCQTWMQVELFVGGMFKISTAKRHPKKADCTDVVRAEDVTWNAPECKEKRDVVCFESGRQFIKPNLRELWLENDYAAIRKWIKEGDI